MTQEALTIQVLRRKLDLAFQDISKYCGNCSYEKDCLGVKDTESLLRYVSCNDTRSNWVWKYMNIS